ncbi:hypothetical protein V5P93_001368 [Actinokineospora auranticolor]|uniref:Uncharacterized protein n=1 Tax=Actinokineospora auranticolor TaxID=155976 RepID=A0A2S6GUX6_9PSEU|nr:hypothetical protein [Actinokineospora auranticolor]PPK68996.1 hypothetical protein CLV40_104243 [Actinokineospora auranticolor]
MNRHLVRIVTALATTSVLATTGATIASAAPARDGVTAAQVVELTTAYRALYDAAGDDAALAGRVGELRDVLNHVRGCGVTDLADPADAKAAEVQNILPLPGPINPDLVWALLDLAQSLAEALISVLPPGTPGIPALPQLPPLVGALPDVTAPDLTTPTTPDVTAPDVTVTVPDLTAPEVTAPDLNPPDVAIPELTPPIVTEPDATDTDATDTVTDVTGTDVTNTDATDTATDMTGTDINGTHFTDVTGTVAGTDTTTTTHTGTVDALLPDESDLSGIPGLPALPGGPVDVTGGPAR